MSRNDHTGKQSGTELMELENPVNTPAQRQNATQPLEQKQSPSIPSFSYYSRDTGSRIIKDLIGEYPGVGGIPKKRSFIITKNNKVYYKPKGYKKSDDLLEADPNLLASTSSQVALLTSFTGEKIVIKSEEDSSDDEKDSSDEDDSIPLKDEAEIWQLVYGNDAGVIGVEEFYESNPNKMISLPYVSGDELDTFLEKEMATQTNNLLNLIHIFKAGLLGLKFLHSKGVAHNDAHGKNVKFKIKDGRYIAQWIDFDFSVRSNQGVDEFHKAKLKDLTAFSRDFMKTARRPCFLNPQRSIASPASLYLLDQIQKDQLKIFFKFLSFWGFDEKSETTIDGAITSINRIIDVVTKPRVSFSTDPLDNFLFLYGVFVDASKSMNNKIDEDDVRFVSILKDYFQYKASENENLLSHVFPALLERYERKFYYPYLVLSILQHHAKELGRKSQQGLPIQFFQSGVTILQPDKLKSVEDLLKEVRDLPQLKTKVDQLRSKFNTVDSILLGAF